MTSTNACSALLAPSSVVIVGCFGRMGGMLFREAGSKGYGVRGIDKPFDDLEPLSRASLVIVCIPAAFFEQTLHRLCPHMREDAILCDITSVKVAPMQQMENIWQGSIVGTHPLFGPQHGMDEDLPIALVRGKNCNHLPCLLRTDSGRRDSEGVHHPLLQAPPQRGKKASDRGRSHVCRPF